MQLCLPFGLAYFKCMKIHSCDAVSPIRALDFCSVLQGARLLVSKMSVLENSSEGVWMCHGASRIFVAGLVFKRDCLTIGTSIPLFVKSKSSSLQQIRAVMVHARNQ